MRSNSRMVLCALALGISSFTPIHFAEAQESKRQNSESGQAPEFNNELNSLIKKYEAGQEPSAANNHTPLSADELNAAPINYAELQAEQKARTAKKKQVASKKAAKSDTKTVAAAKKETVEKIEAKAAAEQPEMVCVPAAAKPAKPVQKKAAVKPKKAVAKVAPKKKVIVKKPSDVVVVRAKEKGPATPKIKVLNREPIVAPPVLLATAIAEFEPDVIPETIEMEPPALDPQEMEPQLVDAPQEEEEIEFEPAPEPVHVRHDVHESGDMATIVKAKTSIRLGPNASSSALMLAHEGDRFPIKMRAGAWTQVGVGDGIKAWVRTADLQSEE